MSETSIEWTDITWNPTTGCSKVSEGCKHCYAERMAKRLKGMNNPRYKNGFEPTEHEEALTLPYLWKKPKKIFVNSMSDLFHESISEDFIKKVFKVMNETPLHTYQILTKRPERALDISRFLDWTPNIWQGTSIENNRVCDRVDYLRQIPAAIRFLSIEPLIGVIENLNLNNIQWVIVGGESGPGARPMKEEWVQSILSQCQQDGVAFFFKQWGGVNKKKTGRLLNGVEWNEFPDIINA
jgi:protein gp37